MGLSKAAREKGYVPVPQPTPHISAILRRVARGFVLATRIEVDGRSVMIYRYDDGTVIRDHKKNPVTATAISKMIHEGWLIPIKGEALPLDGSDGPPQRYRARTLADGLLPKFVAPSWR